MRSYTGHGYTDVDIEDVAAMRKGARWVAKEGTKEWDKPRQECRELADLCRLVADRVEAALRRGDTAAANREAAEWPDSVGPWA